MTANTAGFRKQLETARLVHVDAGVIGHHLVADPQYLSLTRELFEALRSGRAKAQVSSMSVYQVLAEAYRRGHDAEAREIAKILTVHPGLSIVPVTPEIATQAAEVKAQLGGSTERAMQIATALIGGADLYVTEHTTLRRIVGMSVVNLDSYA